MEQLARNNYYHLIFDDKDITQRTGFYIVSMQDSKNFNVGINRNVNTIQGALNKKLFLGIDNNNFQFEVTLVKASKVKDVFIAEEITQKDIENLCRYILRNEPKAIEKDNKLYYGIFTTGEGYNTINNKGYITFKFVMTEPYIYSKEIVKEFDTSISDEIELKNDTDLIDEETFIDIEFNSDFEFNPNPINLFNKNTSTYGSLWNDGTIQKTKEQKISDYIIISDKKNLNIKMDNYFFCSFGWYDESKNFICRTVYLKTIEKPTNAKYVRISYNADNNNEDSIIFTGTIANTYDYLPQNSIIIKNMNNNDCIKLDNLISNHNYKIYGEEMLIIDETNPKAIIYSPEFIKLDYKPNIIKIECNSTVIGAIKYKIKYSIK